VTPPITTHRWLVRPTSLAPVAKRSNRVGDLPVTDARPKAEIDDASWREEFVLD
jgi:hypothetical protein